MAKGENPIGNPTTWDDDGHVGQVSGRVLGQRFIAVVLLFAAMNALSYFYWSGGWGNLFGNPEGAAVGIGFPIRFFVQAAPAVQSVFDAPLLLADLAIGVAVSFAVGLTFAGNSSSGSLNQSQPASTASQVPAVSGGQGRSINFSIRELLISSAIISIVMFLAGSLDQPWVSALKVIYLAGPILLAWTAYMSQRLGPGGQSVCTLVLTGIFMIAAGILAEQILEIRDFTRGLMGIFVCWIPQITLFAALLVWFQPNKAA